jgi:hypothetical protein
MAAEYSSDSICTLQRDGREIGLCFTVNDKPGMSANEAWCRK